MAATEAQCTVRHFKTLTPTVFEIGFEPEHPIAFQGGQFISVVVPGAGPGGRDLRRAYSIASAPESPLIELCVKLVEEGPGSGYLHSLKIGDRFRGFAPYGDFLYEPKAGRHAFFVATGTGIAPFRSMVTSSAYRAEPPSRALCVLGVRTEDELLYGAELQSVAGLEFLPAVTRASSGFKGFRGRVTDFFKSATTEVDWKGSEFYLCGNGAMIAEMKQILADKGVEKTSIHQEIYYK